MIWFLIGSQLISRSYCCKGPATENSSSRIARLVEVLLVDLCWRHSSYFYVLEVQWRSIQLLCLCDVASALTRISTQEMLISKYSSETEFQESNVLDCGRSLWLDSHIRPLTMRCIQQGSIQMAWGSKRLKKTLRTNCPLAERQIIIALNLTVCSIQKPWWGYTDWMIAEEPGRGLASIDITASSYPGFCLWGFHLPHQELSHMRSDTPATANVKSLTGELK